MLEILNMKFIKKHLEKMVKEFFQKQLFGIRKMYDRLMKETGGIN